MRWHYLYSLLTATEQTSISKLQGLFGTGTLLPFNLQTTKVAFIDGQRLKGLFRTQVTLREQIRHLKKKKKCKSNLSAISKAS